MSEIDYDAVRFNWKLPAYALVAVALTLPPLLVSSWDGAGLLWFFVVLPIVTVCLLVVAAHNAERQKLATVLMLLFYAGLLWPRWTFSYNLRAHLRWLAFSEAYKNRVLSQPVTDPQGLKHAEWDGAGFAGSETIVYVVLDPADSLKPFAATQSQRKAPALPCEVWQIIRLEPKWYSVTFYTDTGWNGC